MPHSPIFAFALCFFANALKVFLTAKVGRPKIWGRGRNMNTIWLFLIPVPAFFYFVVLPTIVVGIVERCAAGKLCAW